jgi:hypothetical protein
MRLLKGAGLGRFLRIIQAKDEANDPESYE